MSRKKKVAIFMRGSTNKQTSAGRAKRLRNSRKQSARPVTVEDDLPLQRSKIIEFVESQPEWELTDLEYVEAGVSGFHTHYTKRKGLNDAFNDAKKGLFDILVIYKLDRFGRRSVESLNHAVKFLKYCRIWVVDKRREFTNNGDADEIMNFIEFWSAKKSSMDTKVRVTDMMELIHKEGYWTGGNPPYGFESHEEMANMLQQIPEEAEIVKDIYRMYTSEGLGMLKIAGRLNEQGKKTRTGRKWNSESVRKVLTNTIYKGYLSYGKTKQVEGEFGSYQKQSKEYSVSERYWEEYDLVGESTWEKAQKIRGSRTGNSTSWGGKVPSRGNSGKGLLVGILKCECGSNMTHGSASDWADRKRTKKKAPYGIYRCLTRLKSGVAACGAEKGSYRASEIDELVLDKVKEYTKELVTSNVLADIQEKTVSASKEIKEKLGAVKEDVERWKKAKDRANSELMKVFMGEGSGFSEEQLKEMYDRAVEELDKAEKVHAEYEALYDAEGVSEIDVMKLQDMLSDWGHLLEAATIEEKRQMVRAVVDEVSLKGTDISIEVNLDVPKFFESSSGARESAPSLQTVNGRSPYGGHIAGIIKKLRRTFPEPLREKIIS